MFEFILLYNALLGLIWNGKLRGKLFTLNRYRMSELTPESTLSLMTFVTFVYFDQNIGIHLEVL